MKKIQWILTIISTLCIVGGFYWLENHQILFMMATIITSIVLLIGLIGAICYYIIGEILKSLND